MKVEFDNDQRTLLVFHYLCFELEKIPNSYPIPDDICYQLDIEEFLDSFSSVEKNYLKNISRLLKIIAKINEKDSDAFCLLGRIYNTWKALGNCASKAKESYERAVALGPNSLDAWAELIKLVAQGGYDLPADKKLAKELLEKAISLNQGYISFLKSMFPELSPDNVEEDLA